MEDFALPNNNLRFDLSDRLIHFFRDVDVEGDSAPYMPEHFAFNSFVEGTTYPAFFLLRSAIRSQRLWATWSMRNGERTIYGRRPAICFTEMPLAAFLETSVSRSLKKQAISSYALSFRKTALFDAGANPVIYGLTDRFATLPSGKGGGRRVFPSRVLAPAEQYRYVTYAPTARKPIDWSHEREWRMPFNGSVVAYEKELREYGVISDARNVPGFDISPESLSGIGVIVKSTKQASWVAHDILSLIDRQVIKRRHFDHILILNELPDPQALYSLEATRKLIANATISFDAFFEYSKHEVQRADEAFARMVRVAATETGTEDAEKCRGGCWLWFPDALSDFVRKLVLAGRVIINHEGRYLAKVDDLIRPWPRTDGVQILERIAQLIQSEVALESTWFVTTKSSNPDAVPFSVGWDFLESRAFYNRA